MEQASLASRLWDEQYKKAKYDDENPVEFVEKIISTLRQQNDLCGLRGLYVGCGSGRNYVPLADAGMDGLRGIDISAVAIQKLSMKHPHLAHRIERAGFEAFEPASLLNYIIAIQVFQHGSEQEIDGYFKRSFNLLDKHGLLFLRVNSAATEIYFEHKIVERNSHGGFTATYTQGPKRGLNIHFFSKNEILERLKSSGFEIICRLKEDTAQRSLPKTGTWSQWEVIARKKSAAGKEY